MTHRPSSALGLDLGHETVRDAERWLSENSAVLGAPPRGAGLVACTHLVHGPHPRVAVSLERWAALPDPLPRSVDSAVETRIAAAHAGRRGGRAVIYPGAEALTGVLPLRDLLTLSAIERVRVLGGDAEPIGSTLVDTRDFVRPEWMSGVLTLVLTPAPAGMLAPFEVPNPTPCCADHA